MPPLAVDVYWPVDALLRAQGFSLRVDKVTVSKNSRRFMIVLHELTLLPEKQILMPVLSTPCLC